ncbi:MAG: phenylpyruvate tautomerase PptA (4-oxalocrotonate tautomerase family) [Planctomycetota bacterium]|jgi:phenylpyruvate tautomerase PptA (4-oxalocrotonate tautomerase family)
MPILNVEVVGELASNLRVGLAERLANAAGGVLNSRPQGTWVKLSFLPAGQYAENEGGSMEGALPVFVSLLRAEVATGQALKEQVLELTEAIAICTGRPSENVHLIIEPAAAGRVAFGGTLIP